MGILIAVDGVDASGKQTHTELLYQTLAERGVKAKLLSFPAYGSPSAELVKLYLSGAFGGNAEDVNAYAASTFFAADRFATYRMDWKADYENGTVLIADRYVSSNMIHQAGKIENLQEKDRFLDWVSDLEFQIYGIPKPDLTIFLDMPVRFGRQLMAQRENKFDGTMQKDIHERDCGYLERSYQNACYVAEKYNWTRIPCVEGERIRSIAEIQKDILCVVEPILKKGSV